METSFVQQKGKSSSVDRKAMYLPISFNDLPTIGQGQTYIDQVQELQALEPWTDFTEGQVVWILLQTSTPGPILNMQGVGAVGGRLGFPRWIWQICALPPCALPGLARLIG